MHDNDTKINDAVEKFTPLETDSLILLQCKFFVLLHEDEITRQELVTRTTLCKGYFGAVPKDKASNFYESLHNKIFPVWISNEHISIEQFIDNIRMEYLVS
jgi:hypothetical protein